MTTTGSRVLIDFDGRGGVANGLGLTIATSTSIRKEAFPDCHLMKPPEGRNKGQYVLEGIINQ
jgi:hypothetical protein